MSAGGTLGRDLGHGRTGIDCSFSNSALSFATSAFCPSKSASIRAFFLAVAA